MKAYIGFYTSNRLRLASIYFILGFLKEVVSQDPFIYFNHLTEPRRALQPKGYGITGYGVSRPGIQN